jgi:2-polyprenyl-3-methyl-5-hydroxy-6-metoxy-1,4-benzoquinol methylase
VASPTQKSGSGMLDFTSGSHFYTSANDDERQDIEVGDFRGRALHIVEKEHKVLEIGAGYAPLFRKSEGYRVKIVDHLETEELKAKYRAMGVDTSHIEDVDYVSRGESIPDLVGGQRFKYVFASHVVEHTTDFVGFLRGCSEVMEDNGAIILLVPDRRYCFDFFQPLTDSAKVLADSVRKSGRHTLESLYREEMQVEAEYGDQRTLAWWQGTVSDIHLMRTDPVSRYKAVVESTHSSEYVDAHEYFFIPSTFNLIVDEMNLLGLLPLHLSLLTRARGCEFMAVLTKAPLRRMPTVEFLELKKALAVRSIREQMEAYSKLMLFS